MLFLSTSSALPVETGDNVFDHKSLVHHFLDFKRLHKHLKPIYQRLTSPELLGRCKPHLTQNANESYHHSLWTRCSKLKNHTLRQVRFAVNTSWMEYNFGPKALNSMDGVYGMHVGRYTSLHRQLKETKRLSKSEWTAAGNEKKRRKKVADGKQRATEEDADASYGPGRF